MQQFYAHLNEALKGLYHPDEIKFIGKMLLMEMAEMTPNQIYACKDKIFPEETLETLFAAVKRISENEPIQYVIGHTYFYDLKFKVAPGVLIPRPETEELVDWILRDPSVLSIHNPHILDIGTGSGCLAISLAKNLAPAKVDAWDISPVALDICNENATLNQVALHTSKMDVLQPKELPENESWHIIVSNPPYIKPDEAATMKRNVLDFEPHLALFASENNPLEFYEAISKFAFKTLENNGLLYFEINEHLGEETLEAVQKQGFKSVEIKKDINGKSRMIRAKK